jgi:hypothetical protein
LIQNFQFKVSKGLSTLQQLINLRRLRFLIKIEKLVTRNSTTVDKSKNPTTVDKSKSPTTVYKPSETLKFPKIPPKKKKQNILQTLIQTPPKLLHKSPQFNNFDSSPVIKNSPRNPRRSLDPIQS